MISAVRERCTQELITTVVRCRLPEGAALGAARRLFESTTPAQPEVPGLLRRYYLGGEDLVGGVYFWENRQAAERFYTAQWRRQMMERLGVQPDVLFIERSMEEEC